MKVQSFSRRQSAFSMVELMVVVGIMVILAGLLISALPGIQSTINRNKVQTLIAEIETGLSRYQIDHGNYPIPEAQPSGDSMDARDQAGIEGAATLYKHLSGDWDLDGGVDFDTDEKVYVQNLAYDLNTDAKEPRSTSVGGQYMVIDSYGNPIRYLAQPPNIDSDKRLTINPTYDIWSIVDARATDEEDQARHITNWQAN